ncbi:hypothetical protein ENKOMM257B_22580 [Enterobacter kobei]
MSTIQDIRNQLSTLVTEAHKVACSLDIGDERTEAFELYEALRRLQRQVQLVKSFPQLTHFSHHHITTRTGTKMKTTDATDSQL